jgi:hypothetical protein
MMLSQGYSAISQLYRAIKRIYSYECIQRIPFSPPLEGRHLITVSCSSNKRIQRWLYVDISNGEFYGHSGMHSSQ